MKDTKVQSCADPMSWLTVQSLCIFYFEVESHVTVLWQKQIT